MNIQIDRERLSGAIRIKRQATPAHELAATVGVSSATIIRAERGTHNPTALNMVRICRWLGRPVEDFIRDVPDEIEEASCAAVE